MTSETIDTIVLRVNYLRNLIYHGPTGVHRYKLYYKAWLYLRLKPEQMNIASF